MHVRNAPDTVVAKAAGERRLADCFENGKCTALQRIQVPFASLIRENPLGLLSQGIVGFIC